MALVTSDKEPITKSIVSERISDYGVCPDFDSDCIDVTDPLVCLLGHPPKNVLNVHTKEVYRVYLPTAAGRCPYLGNSVK